MDLAVLIFSAIAHFVIGIYTFQFNRGSYTHRFFLLFSLISIGWGVTNYLSLHQSTPESTLNFIRWNMFWAIFHAYSLYLLITTFPSNKIELKKLPFLGTLALTLIVAGLTRTPLIFESITGLGAGANPIPGSAIPLFGFTAGFFILASIYLLVKGYKKAKGVQKSQFEYLIVGVIGSALLIFITQFLFVVVFKNNSLLFLGPAYTLVFIGTTAYSIVAHQLFDIRVIIKRTVVYSGLLLFTLGTYSMIIFFFSTLFGGESTFNPKTFVANLIAATFIAIGFDPIKRYLTQVTDKYLFKGEYDSQAVLSALSRQLTTSLDLKEVTQSLVFLIKNQMRLSHAAVVTFTTEENQVVVKDTTQEGYPDPTVLQLPSENLLLQQFARNPELIVADVLRRQCNAGNPDDPQIQACKLLLVDLEKLQIAVAIPILVAQKAIGVFLAGEKLSGDSFSKDDVQFLTIAANQTATAIEKTRFWEEDQMKSEFVSIASHELLTPTAAMKGYLSMILEENMGQVDPTARRFLEKVSQSADRLAHLVEDLLNVSRIESGRLKINKREFSLLETVAKAVEELQVNAKNKSLDLAFAAPANALESVYGDPDHVYRVLVNLVGNAIKYTERGWVRCFVTQYDPTHLLFAVSDSGLGIPKDAQPHLFEKFYRADRKEIDGIQGTGLGLYISKKIIDLMGGQMWVESEVGKGTTFYFTLPTLNGIDQSAEKSAPATPMPTTSPATQPPSSENAPLHPVANPVPMSASSPHSSG